MELIGQGSFAKVCRCFDHKLQKYFAVKIIRNKPLYYKQGLCEVEILEQLGAEIDKHHAIGLETHFLFRNHLVKFIQCLVFELLSVNLYEVLQQNRFKGLQINFIRKIAQQILQTLKITFKHRIIHADLKPENILLTHSNRSSIKVIDFGSSCFENRRVYSYIQSRFYRAPEIVFQIAYTPCIDMWSLGCILAELYTGAPLFPADTEQSLIDQIISLKGMPPTKYCEAQLTKQLEVRLQPTATLSERLKCTDQIFLNFIDSKFYLGCIEWLPEDRITPEEAFSHVWLSQIV